ncbi:DUF4405 domain-containing protein [Vibrio algarum]|uniref:DUF4405 domain-containing protein n=1 Tax=Vibrio algarum TaxID=3020714 RepID=A0ABT4YT97_9VIBR|nr:DUF4405 domain-containing protein [Vibrio sp. KJ40-1]MDB1124274.1 DUF4405 domain-containing protein [Vibrio sp. KJ40-1]
MLNKLTDKSWLSPFLAVTYLAVSVTGVCLLFHIDFYGIRPIHDWGGLAFVIAGVLHSIVNWRKFTSYFTRSIERQKAIWGAGVATALVAVLLVSMGSGKDGHRHRDHHERVHASVKADVSSYANLE